MFAAITCVLHSAVPVLGYFVRANARAHTARSSPSAPSRSAAASGRSSSSSSRGARSCTTRSPAGCVLQPLLSTKILIWDLQTWNSNGWYVLVLVFGLLRSELIRLLRTGPSSSAGSTLPAARPCTSPPAPPRSPSACTSGSARGGGARGEWAGLSLFHGGDATTWRSPSIITALLRHSYSY
jgi:hypothetical protein